MKSVLAMAHTSTHVMSYIPVYVKNVILKVTINSNESTVCVFCMSYL